MSLFLVSVSWLASVLDVYIMHIGALVTSIDDLGMTGGSPRNDPRMDEGLNWLGPYSWYHENAFVDVSM